MVGNAVWFEIPSSNFERAVNFYEAVFQVTLRRENIGGDLAVFPGGEDSVNGAVVSQEGYVPAANGAVSRRPKAIDTSWSTAMSLSVTANAPARRRANCCVTGLLEARRGLAVAAASACRRQGEGGACSK